MTGWGYIIGGALLAVILLSVLVVLRRRKPVDDALTCYIRGLNLMLRDDQEGALEYFTRAVKRDTQNVDAYLKLAEIFRDRGDAARALRVTRELLVRPGLTRDQREQILASKAVSHESLGQWERAAETWRRLVEMDGANADYQRSLVKSLERGNEWPAALAAGRRLAKLEGGPGLRRLAMSHAWFAQKMFRERQEKEGKNHLRRALRIDPDCPAALLLRADRAVAEDKLKEATEDWSRLVRHRPEWGELAFQRLEQAYYDQGTFEQVPEFLRDALREDQENVGARVHLAKLYHRKGESEEGIRLCRDGLDLKPSEPGARRLRMVLVMIYRETDRHREAWKEIDRSGCLEPASGEAYRCSACGSQAAAFDWRCSRCGEWETMMATGRPARQVPPMMSVPGI